MTETVPICETCIYGTKLSCTNEVLCRKYGIVFGDGVCKKYQLDLTKKTVRRKRKPKLSL